MLYVQCMFSVLQRTYLVIHLLHSNLLMQLNQSYNP
uniref:Uncharacterized protein n=1 Tax=Rhizophora mucronata TaxID=61149 RepID=A0A2P2MEZ4_RHIMU